MLDVDEQAVDSDGAGDCGRLGENPVGIGRNPVAPRGGHRAHRHHDGFLRHRQAEFALDLLGRRGAASRTVHAQHDRLDPVVLPKLTEFAGKPAASDLADLAFAIDDVTFGIDDRDLIGPAAGRFIAPGRHACIRAQTDLLETLLRALPAPCLHLQLIDHLVAVRGAVDQLVRERA